MSVFCNELVISNDRDRGHWTFLGNYKTLKSAKSAIESNIDSVHYYLMFWGLYTNHCRNHIGSVAFSGQNISYMTYFEMTDELVGNVIDFKFNIKSEVRQKPSSKLICN